MRTVQSNFKNLMINIYYYITTILHFDITLYYTIDILVTYIFDELRTFGWNTAEISSTLDLCVLKAILWWPMQAPTSLSFFCTNKNWESLPEMRIDLDLVRFIWYCLLLNAEHETLNLLCIYLCRSFMLIKTEKSLPDMRLGVWFSIVLLRFFTTWNCSKLNEHETCQIQ